MKLHQLLFLSLFLALLCIMNCSVMAAESGKETTEPSPVHIFGKVSLCHDSKTWQPLEKGMTIQGNDWLATGSKSCLILSLNGKDSVTVSNNSICALYMPADEGGKKLWKELYLQNGSMWLNLSGSQAGDMTYSLITPDATITTRGAVFEVVRGTGSDQPEEYWVWTGAITLSKNKKEVTINAKERIIIMANQEIPSKASRFNPANVSQWQKWNENKDTLLTNGNLEKLQKSSPPEVNRAAPHQAIGPSQQTGAQLQQSSGSSQGGQDNSQSDIQRARDMMRVPPAYNPSF